VSSHTCCSISCRYTCCKSFSTCWTFSFRCFEKSLSTAGYR